MVKNLEKIIHFFLYSCLFLTPLFFLPFSFEFLDFNKIYLFLFLVLISFLLWLLKCALNKELRFKKVPFSIFLFVFLIFSILSAIFSVDKIFSLFGFYGRFSNGLIFLLLLVLFYFLIINNFKKENTIFILDLLLISSFFVILISALSVSGVFQRFLKFQILSPVGSFESLSIFLTFILVLLTSLLLTQKSKIKFILYSISFVLSFAFLLLIDFKFSFLLQILSFSLFLIFAILSKIFRENINKLLLPIFLIFLSFFFLFYNPIPRKFQVLREQILPQKISWQVSFGGATENIKSIFFGSGIGTFFYDFSKFKPGELNKTALWLIRFDRASSHLAEILGTMGFFGFLSYLTFLGSFFLVSFLILYKKPEFFIFFLPFLALFLAQIFYYQNFVLSFSFWLFFGLLVLNFEKTPERKISFEKIPELGLIFNSFSILIFVFFIFIFYFAIKFYLADHYYLKAVKSQDVKEQVSLLERAVKLNPFFSQYKIDFARANLSRALAEIQKPIDQQDSNLISNSVSTAINYLKGAKFEGGIEIKGATEISPNWVVGWENLGIVYREIISLTGGQSVDWAIKSFERAEILEPKNPILKTEIGKLYFAKRDLDKAEEKFKLAIELKEDYLDAKIQLALISEQRGNLEEAQRKLEELVSNYPFSVEANFQLGRIYFNQEKIDQAISSLERATLLMPNHSNSLYFLGLCYEKKGEKEKALEYFKKVLELNPGNEVVLSKIKELEK
jgi:tetratricopeptide (TPR) repeat protein